MIVVLADDFTGSAEMSGIGFCLGFQVEIQTGTFMKSPSDMVVVDTNSRSCSIDESSIRVKKAASGIYQDLVFKKVDSVLRGYVFQDLTILLTSLNLSRCLLIPANPSLGRTIRNGCYYIHNQPLHKTDFSRDPEYPIRSSKVVDLLGESVEIPIYILQPDQDLPEKGIIIGETSNEADVSAWVKHLDDKTLPAGAANFFSAFLQTQECCLTNYENDIQFIKGCKTLIVCGTSSSAGRRTLDEFETCKLPIAKIPIDLFNNTGNAQDHLSGWITMVLKQFEGSSVVLVAIDQPVSKDPQTPQRLSQYLSLLIQSVIKEQPVDHLVVEGGSTASTIVNHLGWNCLKVEHVWSQGVVSVRAKEQVAPLLTIKPGSYQWPEEFFKIII